MPAPKTASRFGTEYFRLLTIARHKFDSGESFFYLPMTEQSMASRTRFRFYAFRKALERDMLKHNDPETRKEREEQFKIADIMRLKLEKTRTGWAVRVENAAAEGTAEAAPLADALASLEAEMYEDTHGSEVSVQDQVAAEAENLRALGVERPDSAADLFDVE